MNCREAREELRDFEAGRMTREREAILRAHLSTCEACRNADDAERAITALLRTRLPRYDASDALKARLAATVSLGREAAEPRARAPVSGEVRVPRADAMSDAHVTRRSQRVGAIAGILAIAAAIALFAYRAPRAGEPSPLVIEAVSDHLRTLYAEHPIEIASGGIHQVKPWFTGRLDFAPIVPFAGDDEFALEGGAVAYFIDRKAATFFFKRRLHAISLFVFRADGLAWPSAKSSALVGGVFAYEASARGFHVLLWRRGELGYALVSDVEPGELTKLAARLNGAPAD